MIDIIKEVLKELIKSTEKYNVSVWNPEESSCYQFGIMQPSILFKIYFIKNTIPHEICITSNNYCSLSLKNANETGTSVQFEIPKDDVYSILNSCSELNKKCKDLIITSFKNFVNS